MKNTLKNLILALSILSASQTSASTISFDLLGVGSTVNGFGRDGLYLGPDFTNSSFNVAQYNWTFNTVSLSIDDVTGNGTIHGAMTRQSDNSVWGFDVNLTNLVVRQGLGSNTTRHAYNAASDNLNAILSSTTAGTGVEWQSLSMTPTSPTPYWNNPASTTSSWSGLAMPEIGHINVAELYHHDNYIDSGINGLVFDAWFQRDDCSNCTYQVGDTKAHAIKTSPSPVPLPGALLLFGSGLVGFLGFSRRK